MTNTEIQELIDILQADTGEYERIHITVREGTKDMLKKLLGKHGSSLYVRGLIIKDLKKRIKID